ncbi:hypothetical protein JQ596_15600 [Bradyrhizobium manausense]|uniref:hypothetical protein n=1 Tax=Bradyrhizobium TaxID=374 RepID=UPI001BA811E3|nr:MULTISPECIES: hypothetical protein [Bradyrhizobium]MBR0826969.1 hypothetical protein [Bradyrhizobium manausense]UVO32248.1 hypothetical protein KUF59_17265 [Bradyrhizobium arachidis]
MKVRLLFLATLLLIAGELRAQTPAEKAGFPSKLVIYLAKGPANSCGQGCDRWIAVEGTVDQGAAARIRRFLAGVKDTQRPIYFHSPGGAVDQSFAIGRLLRSRKAIARVGRTIVTACASGTQIDDACLKIKNAGGEVEAELTTRKAMCNSACGYLFLGATTREVAPDAAIAVHNSRLTLLIRGDPPPQVVAELRQQRLAMADRERAAFIAAMGIKGELTDLIKTVKFESIHVLTRPELYRFGIDTRAQPETLWTLEKGARPYARKVVLARKDDGASFRIMEWRLFCENKNRARLLFSREYDVGTTGKSTIVMMAEPGKSVSFGRFPARVGKFDVWSDTVAPDTINAMLSTPRLLMGESMPAADGQSNLTTFEIDTTGFAEAWTQMLTVCPAASTATMASPFPSGPAAGSPTVDAVPP